MQNIDLIKKLQVPVLLTITPNENAINDALLSIYTAQEKGVNLRGVVINNITNDCPASTLTSITRVIEEYSNANILGLLQHFPKQVEPVDLISGILNGIDIESVFNIKIQKLDFN